MKKGRIERITAALLSLGLFLSGCSGRVEGEIEIPIYEGVQHEDYKTYEVGRMNLSSGENIGAALGYALSDSLYTPAGANLVS